MAPKSTTFFVSNPDIVRGKQVRAARALLNWSIPLAAEKCGVGRNTIVRLETGTNSPGIDKVREIVNVFEEYGVLFIDTEIGTGVLLNERVAPTDADRPR